MIVVFPGTGNHDGLCPQVLQSCHRHVGGAAAAQNQNILSLHRDAAVLYQGGKAEVIGVVPEQGAVRPADHGVHRPHFLRRGGQLVEVRNYVLFIGNGHVDAGKVSAAEKIFQLLRLFFKQGVGIVPQMAVNLGGIAVPQLSAQ